MRGELTAGLGWGDKRQPVTTQQAVPGLHVEQPPAPRGSHTGWLLRSEGKRLPVKSATFAVRPSVWTPWSGPPKEGS